MQNIKCFFLSIILIASFLLLKAQQPPQYEYFLEGNVKIVPPTYPNLVGMMLCEEKTFIEVMKSYGYEASYNYSNLFYEAEVWSNKSLYNIKKKGYRIIMMFTPDRHHFSEKIIRDLNQKGLSSTNRNGKHEYSITVKLTEKYQCDVILSVVTDLEGNTSLIEISPQRK